MAQYRQKGKYKAICDVCGFVYPASELRLRPEDRMMVCKYDWEPIHPQKYIKAIPDAPKLPWTRPEPSDVYVSRAINCDALTWQYVYLGPTIEVDMTIYKISTPGPITIDTDVVITVECTLEIT